MSGFSSTYIIYAQYMRHRNLFRIFLIVLFSILGSTSIFIATSNYEPDVSPDSVVSIATARSIRVAGWSVSFDPYVPSLRPLAWRQEPWQASSTVLRFRTRRRSQSWRL